ncbi:uncharacterized protein LOC127850275 isoform X2 [Dreissena polymorpha]|uniref:uncharacterized protein LOC127850275 isoform X2 n=1 Tax=Dreissena polymorpha TaxID=45954 RepID=UPI002264730F|nr:uncharacterized protein LOC127850275 isoform X2 [Dreissena polymorpha]
MALRQCTNMTLISESVKTQSFDMQQVSNNLQTIVNELNKFKSKQEGIVQSLEVSCREKLQEIKDVRKKLNAALDSLENTTMKELEEIRTSLQTCLKKDVENCRRLKDDLQTLNEAVNGLCDKSRKELEFIASRKCLDKILETESYLKENPVTVLSSMIFRENTDIEQYLLAQSSLGRIVDSMQRVTVKRKSEFSIAIPSDPCQNFEIIGICSLPNGQVIVADYHNRKVQLLDQNYKVSSYCDVSDAPCDICIITPSEVAVPVNKDVHFISVSNGQLVKGRKFSLQHHAGGIAHHQGVLYITSGTALYSYTMTGSLVKKLFEDTTYSYTVYRCALSLAGDRIYVTNNTQHKLLTLATEGTLISTFTDPELQGPQAVCVTPSGQVLVCGYNSHTVIQVDSEGKQKLATLSSQKDGLSRPSSVCYNTNTRQIIVGLNNIGKIIVMDFK